MFEAADFEIADFETSEVVPEVPYVRPPQRRTTFMERKRLLKAAATLISGYVTLNPDTPIPTPAAPINTVAPSIIGTAQEGQTLTGLFGSWSGFTSLTGRWKKSGSSSTLSTSPTYVPTSAQVGTALDWEVTATNANGSTVVTVSTTAVTAAPVVVPEVVNAPTITWTSGASTYDPAFTLTGIALADVVELQIDDANTFTSPYDSDTNTVDATEAEDGALTFPAIPTLGFSTTYYARARITRGGLTSAWSNVVSKAMAAEVIVPTTWDAAAKSVAITLSNGDLTATGAEGVGAPQSVLGSKSKTSGKRYFEVVVTPDRNFANTGIGVANALPASGGTPGLNTNSIFYSANSIVKYNNADAGYQAAHETTAAAVFGCAVNADTDKVWFSLNGTFAGDPAAGTGGYAVPGIATYFPLFAAPNDDTGLLRRKASEFTGAVPTGFTGWDD